MSVRMDVHYVVIRRRNEIKLKLFYDGLVFLPARRRPQGLVIIGVCLCALFLSARYLKNGFMDHHRIWWVGAGGEPLEQVQFWC